MQEALNALPSLVPRPNASQLRVDYITATTPTGKWCYECRRGGHATEECWSKENSGTQGSTGGEEGIQV